jgi:hypothetical protein
MRPALAMLLVLLGVADAHACTPSRTILRSPAGAEVQAKALNDRGDIVGFAGDHAVIWKHGGRARDLGLPPGYASAEAYGINDRRVVVGVVYDEQGRTFPFRWARGRTTLLRGPHGRRRQALVPERNAVNARGQVAGTLLIRGAMRAVRWGRGGKPTLLPPLPGHAWTNAWGIDDRGVVSGWSRRRPSDDGENNPVLWSRSGAVRALATLPGRADGAAEATAGDLTVGYLGSTTGPERDAATAWSTPGGPPLFLGHLRARDTYAELAAVNARGQAAGMSGSFTRRGFTYAKPAIWRPGWVGLHRLPIPRRARHHRVVVVQLNDINARGTIVGDVYGLSAKDYGALQRVYPALWRCSFGS